MMETAFSRISIIDLYDRIIAGLRDDNEIRALCNLMVTKLVHIDPDETTRRLDAIADAFRATLSTPTRDNAVKQDHERQEEANKSVLRVTVLLGDKLKSAHSTRGVGATSSGGGGAPTPGSNQVWSTYYDWVTKDFASQIKALQDEGSKEPYASAV